MKSTFAGSTLYFPLDKFLYFSIVKILYLAIPHNPSKILFNRYIFHHITLPKPSFPSSLDPLSLADHNRHYVTNMDVGRGLEIPKCLPTQSYTELFTVPSLHRKLDEDDHNSLPYNIFAPQLATSLMAQQVENGMSYTMFTKQYRMTAGVKVLSSRMCYGGRLESAA